MIETEVKIRLEPEEVSSLSERLVRIGADEVSPPREERNTLFDYPDRRLQKRENALRLRRYEDATGLIFKGDLVADSTFKKREEVECHVSDGEAIKNILEQLGLEAVLHYGKKRRKLKLTLPHESGLICIDETPVGTYVELEGSERWISWVADQM